MLVGRTKEVGVLEDLLGAVRDGLSGVLVLRGEVGIGKTALLDWVAGTAGDMRVACVAGVESEMDLGFAGLYQLLVPLLDGLDRLPAPQRAALQSAFGRAAGPPPDRFLVGLATLTLLTNAAAASRCYAWSITRNGSTGHRPRCLASWRAACSPTGWECCSPSGRGRADVGIQGAAGAS